MTFLVHSLGWTLLHFLWQGTLLALAVAAGLWALEGRDSRLRYATACLGLLLMVAAPPITFLRVRAQPQSALQSAPAERPSTPATASAKPSPRPSQRNWRPEVERAMPWLVLLWALGSLAMSVRLAGGWVWLQWLRRRPATHPAPDAEQLLLLRLCQRMGVGSNLRLLLCNSVPGPTVLGWLRPVILIPPAMLSGLSPQQLEFILAHELAHVLRHDYLVNLFQSIAEVLFFFHPAVWWVSKQIRQEREQASDDLAVRLYGDALDYAQALTALEALASRSTPFSSAPRLALGAQGGDFMSRIHRLISPTAPTLLAPRAGLVVLLLMGGAFALQAHAKAAPSKAQQETPLAKGKIHLRRYDASSPDGANKVGTIDLRAVSVPLSTIERALGRLQQMATDPGAGFVDLEVTVTPAEATDRLYNYQFTGVEPARVITIIRNLSGLPSIEKKLGLLVIQRLNSFNPQGGLVPSGLFVNVWAGEVPADLVLDALNELEEMTPKAGVPQEVRRVITPEMGKARKITMDLAKVDPMQVRGVLEAELAKIKP